MPPPARGRSSPARPSGSGSGSAGWWPEPGSFGPRRSPPPPPARAPRCPVLPSPRTDPAPPHRERLTRCSRTGPPWPCRKPGGPPGVRERAGRPSPSRRSPAWSDCIRGASLAEATDAARSSGVEQPVDRALEPTPKLLEEGWATPEVGILLDHGERPGARPPHQLEVIGEAGELQVRESRLTDVEERALAPEPQILVGQLEPVRGPDHGLESGPGLLVVRGALVEEDARRPVLGAPDPSPQLMQLSQAETLGVLDQHHRRVRHVHADLDHS